jgi:hypothetical protein
LASTPAQGQLHSRHHPSRTSYSQINQYGDDRTTGGALAEPVSYTLPQPLDENGGGGREKNLTRSMIKAGLVTLDQRSSEWLSTSQSR